MTQLVEMKQKEENLLLLKQSANTMEFFNEQQMFIINEHNERIRKAQEQNNDNDKEDVDDGQNENPTPQTSVVIEPLALNTPSKVLRTEAEVDTYIADIKAQIMAKLKEGEQAVMVMQN